MDIPENAAHELTVRGTTISPALIGAPMAGLTHSALRRLIADFGGYGALSTEMLSARTLKGEHLASSPYTKRRPQEGAVICQLLVADPSSAHDAIVRLAQTQPFAIDINLGCPAPEVRRQGGGTVLFLDTIRLADVLTAVRQAWPGLLTVKCRLGRNTPTWRDDLLARVKIFEDTGVDIVTLHPRFIDEKLKRTARWDVFDWVCERTRLPVVGNGDICTLAQAAELRCRYPRLAGIMVGRILAAQPWFFAAAQGPAPSIDYGEVWDRLYRYVLEDFTPERALGRLKEFTAYYAANFMFGHELFRAAQNAGDVTTLRHRALRFLDGNPKTVSVPSFAGI